MLARAGERGHAGMRAGFGGSGRVSAGGDGRRRAPDRDGRLTACGRVDY